MIGSVFYGWECPRCHAVYAPTHERCTSCSPATELPGMGTGMSFTLKGLSVQSQGAFGTIFLSPPKSEATQADETVQAWLGKGFSAKTLITAALDVMDEPDDEDDEDDDDE